MTWELKNDRPIYIQIVENIQMKIISGFYQAGDKLPSVRDLAAEAAVNPNTMQKALADLEQKGLIFAQRTSGRFITEDINMIKDLKSKEALKKITEFLTQMQNLGISQEEILALIKEEINKE